jgi:hypothetical protein
LSEGCDGHRATCTMWHMTTMKRRVIYMSDTEWSALREVAGKHDQTVSSLIRERVGLLPRDGWDETPIEKATRDFGEIAAETENSMIDLAHAVRGDRFNSQPFTGPIPKKGK